MSILNNLNLNSRGKLIVHSLKLNSRGSFIVAARLSASICAAFSLEARRLASTCLSLSTLITSALIYRLALTLTDFSETRLSSSIATLSTSVHLPASALTISILAALVVYRLYGVSKHIKI